MLSVVADLKCQFLNYCSLGHGLLFIRFDLPVFE